jgi:D-aminoacyl-tRNA deacylase
VRYIINTAKYLRNGARSIDAFSIRNQKSGIRNQKSRQLTFSLNRTRIWLVMRAVIQRVSQAEVLVGGIKVSRIKEGILALVAISHQDTEKDLQWMAKKIIELRIFNDAQGKLNLSLRDVGGKLLIVSQFTLYGDCRKGRRPSYTQAARPSEAQKLYQEFIEIARQWMPDVQTGQFQAMMEVALINSGPVTLILDSSEQNR